MKQTKTAKSRKHHVMRASAVLRFVFFPRSWSTVGGKEQAVWAQGPAPPCWLRPRDSRSTPGPGLLPWEAEKRPHLAGLRMHGKMRTHCQRLQPGARRRVPLGATCAPCSGCSKDTAPCVPSPVLVQLVATLPLTGPLPMGVAVPSPELQQSSHGIESEDGCARARCHTTVTPGRANLQIIQDTAPDRRILVSVPHQTHVLCLSESAGRGLAPTCLHAGGGKRTHGFY